MTKTRNDATVNLRVDTLVHELEDHPHRDELLELIFEQLIDDLYL